MVRNLPTVPIPTQLSREGAYTGRLDTPGGSRWVEMGRVGTLGGSVYPALESRAEAWEFGDQYFSAMQEGCYLTLQ